MRTLLRVIILLASASHLSWARCPDTGVPELQLMTVGELRSAYCNANEQADFYSTLSDVYAERERRRLQRSGEASQVQQLADLIHSGRSPISGRARSEAYLSQQVAQLQLSIDRDRQEFLEKEKRLIQSEIEFSHTTGVPPESDFGKTIVGSDPAEDQQKCNDLKTRVTRVLRAMHIEPPACDGFRILSERPSKRTSASKAGSHPEDGTGASTSPAAAARRETCWRECDSSNVACTQHATGSDESPEYRACEKERGRCLDACR
jgi:hypothetical protein